MASSRSMYVRTGAYAGWHVDVSTSDRNGSLRLTVVPPAVDDMLYPVYFTAAPDEAGYDRLYEGMHGLASQLGMLTGWLVGHAAALDRYIWAILAAAEAAGEAGADLGDPGGDERRRKALDTAVWLGLATRTGTRYATTPVGVAALDLACQIHPDVDPPRYACDECDAQPGQDCEPGCQGAAV